MALALMKIGELASHTGSSVETIRFYEKQNLLPRPQRSAGNYRLYDASHVERLQFIRHCRSLDMTLEEVRALQDFRDGPNEDCAGVNDLLDRHIGHVGKRIRELKALQAQLKQLRSQCHSTQSTRECGILQGLSEAGEAPPSILGSHTGRCH
jgi:Cd(II)/Pb(II)-responsive transcriptional regulator